VEKNIPAAENNQGQGDREGYKYHCNHLNNLQIQSERCGAGIHLERD